MSDHYYYPLMTSDNTTGDTATQGFNDSVLETMNPALKDDAPGTVGLKSSGVDVLAGVEWYPDNDPVPQESKWDDKPLDARTVPEVVPATIRALQHRVDGVPVVRFQAPNASGTLGFFFPAPNGNANLVRVTQVLTPDDKRYRVILHPWVSTGTVGQVWVGANPGDVGQTASGNISLSAFPLNRGGTNSANMSEFHWNDDLWAAVDISATVDTYLFVTVERYA